MKKKLLLSLIIVLTFTINSNSQSTPENIIEKFFENYENISAEVAVTEMYATNPWMMRFQDAINKTKNQLLVFDNELVGKYQGYEFLTKKQIGNSYSLHSYLLKFDRQAVRLTFQFYKPSNEWRLDKFKFDDNFEVELEESAKIYNLELKNE